MVRVGGVGFQTKDPKECLEIMAKAGVDSTGLDPKKINCMFCPAMEGCPKMWGPEIDPYDKVNLVAAFKSKSQIRIFKAMKTYTDRQKGHLKPYNPEVLP